MTAHPPLTYRRSGTALDGERQISIVAAVSGSQMSSGAVLNQTLDQLKQPAPGGVRWVEVRADHTGDIDPGPLHGLAPGGLLYSLRSTTAGGGCADPADRRRERLIAAADRYDLVDLEADRDLHPEVLDRIPPERRVLSWHGPATDLTGLRHTFAALTGVKARLYRLAPAAQTIAQALAPLLLLKALGRDDVTAYARGPVATWTRVLATRYGAPVAFSRLDDHGTEGELSLRRLRLDYPTELVSRAKRLYGIIGTSTNMSLCPMAHNTAYWSLGIPALFLPFSSDELPRALDELRSGLDELGLPLGAMAVVAPHKDAALALATEATPFARRAGAASLLVRAGSGWWADTEAAGVVATLAAHRVEVARRRVAVIGCGGAGRAAAAGISRAGGRVTLVNRGIPPGVRAAKLLGLPFVPLHEFDPCSYDVLVHATPVNDAMPFSIDGIDPATVIFDLSYGGRETRLIAAARANGHPAIDGTEMTLVQLPRQFHRMTGQHIPIGIVRAAQAEFRQNPAPAADLATTRRLS
jgi:3-dehydroquinate dehydratase/shikimate dehydrogenase